MKPIEKLDPYNPERKKIHELVEAVNTLGERYDYLYKQDNLTIEGMSDLEKRVKKLENDGVEVLRMVLPTQVEPEGVGAGYRSPSSKFSPSESGRPVEPDKWSDLQKWTNKATKRINSLTKRLDKFELVVGESDEDEYDVSEALNPSEPDKHSEDYKRGFREAIQILQLEEPE